MERSGTGVRPSFLGYCINTSSHNMIHSIHTAVGVLRRTADSAQHSWRGEAVRSACPRPGSRAARPMAQFAFASVGEPGRERRLEMRVAALGPSPTATHVPIPPWIAGPRHCLHLKNSCAKITGGLVAAPSAAS
ncbi:hypothetical protein BS50DRAFT_96726 [Corynespora cassiicola Philippines]|uniref:Uncharacterized protein n=1 Tax=Corynespora cassiicola Philippines TaxID=1448308 RepID=A0A2T2NF43_CORCC|nr:hypothetical protein BS50DRAFT_96726 [Corynespora cassiicola Philippines]